MKTTTIWFSTAQAAEHAGRHPVTVRNALASGELHGGQRSAGCQWRIHRDCLDAWVAAEKCEHQREGLTAAAS